MATSTQSSLMCLPTEIRQLILLEAFDYKHPTIEFQPFEDRFKPSFGTAPLLVCKNMRCEAIAVLMRGIEIQFKTICDFEYVQLLPEDIRRCIRYLSTTYVHSCCGKRDTPDDGWLDPSALVHLSSLESIYIDVCGEHSCEVPSAESRAELQAEVENLDAAGDIDPYLWNSNNIDVDSTSKLDHPLVIHVAVLLSICYDDAFEQYRMDGTGYIDVVATYYSKDKTWKLQEHTGSVKFSRGCVTITPYAKG